MPHAQEPSNDARALLAEQLRAVLAAVDSGQLPAERDQMAFLRGGIAVLELLAAEGTTTGCNGHRDGVSKPTH